MSWFSRLKRTFHSARLDAELDEELRDHLERRAAEYRASGMSDEEARHRAARRFGNVSLTRERSREVRLWAACDASLQDLRYAWRTMRRAPGFWLTAVLSIALAIGANTAIFSIVDAAMLRPLPVADPSRLIALTWPDIVQPGEPAHGERESFSYPNYAAMRQAGQPAAELALFGYPGRVEVRQGGSEAPLEHAMRQFVSGDAFQMLGVTPSLGRLFTAEDDRIPGGHPLAVLSYDYWISRFGRDPAILGRGIEIEGQRYAVLGVAAPGFFGVEPGKFVDIWLPAMMYNKAALTNPGWGWLRIMGRIKPDVRPEQVEGRLQPGFHRDLVERAARWPSMPAGIRKQFLEARIRVRVASNGPSGFRRDFARPLWTVLAIGGLMLLIACTNVASLLLARAVARSPEMAMRIALGAGRSRIVRQLVTENLALAITGASAGWLLARASAPALVRILSKESDPIRFALAMNSRMLLFSALIAMVAALLFGMTPAWQASATQPAAALRAGSGQAGKLRLGRVFVGIQAALAFCLVLTGAAFLFSLRNLVTTPAGFDPRNVTVFGISAEARNQPEAARRALMEQTAARIGEAPGVQNAALALWPILQGTGWSEQVIIPGHGPSDREEIFYGVTPGYFATLRTPLVDGRDFIPHDSAASEPIATIVNVAFARKYFATDDVVGKSFERPAGPRRVRMTIVGLAANAHYGDLKTPAEPIVYVPMSGESSFTAYVRSSLPTASVVRAVEQAVASAGTGARVRDVTTVEALVGNTLVREKLLASVGAGFAAISLILATIGIYGILSYSVSRRTREIGIRTALGAQRYEVVALVVRDAGALVGGGLAAGLAGSFALNAALRSLLFEVRAVDPAVLGTAVAIFVLAASVAASVPARRAVAMDATVALRFD